VAFSNPSDSRLATGIRVSRRTMIQDVVVEYDVTIDGDSVGRLRHLRSHTFAVAPGQHTVQLRSRSSSSECLSLAVEPGQIRTLRTWSRLRRLPLTWKGALTGIINPFGSGTLGFEFDPWGLWGSPKPWIVMSESAPQSGPKRFDGSDYEAT
jgi:hypothetical protein